MSRAGDMVLLDLLDRVERQGATFDATARALRMTRAAVAGAVRRVRIQSDRVPDLCTRPENRDGGMPARWWAA